MDNLVPRGLYDIQTIEFIHSLDDIRRQKQDLSLIKVLVDHSLILVKR